MENELTAKVNSLMRDMLEVKAILGIGDESPPPPSQMPRPAPSISKRLEDMEWTLKTLELRCTSSEETSPKELRGELFLEARLAQGRARV